MESRAGVTSHRGRRALADTHRPRDPVAGSRRMRFRNGGTESGPEERDHFGPAGREDQARPVAARRGAGRSRDDDRLSSARGLDRAGRAQLDRRSEGEALEQVRGRAARRSDDEPRAAPTTGGSGRSSERFARRSVPRRNFRPWKSGCPCPSAGPVGGWPSRTARDTPSLSK